MAENYVVWFDKLRMTDVETVGGKMRRWAK